MSTVMRTPLFDRLLYSKRFAAWTMILWIAYAVAVIAGPAFTSNLGSLDYVDLSWCLSAVAGIGAGALGLRKQRHWLLLALLASVLLVISSGIYWSTLVEKLLLHEDQKTMATLAHRILQMNWMGFQAASRTNTTLFPILAVATFYREMLMPVLQLVILTIVGGAWITQRASTRPSS